MMEEKKRFWDSGGYSAEALIDKEALVAAVMADADSIVDTEKLEELISENVESALKQFWEDADVEFVGGKIWLTASTDFMVLDKALEDIRRVSLSDVLASRIEEMSHCDDEDNAEIIEEFQMTLDMLETCIGLVKGELAKRKSAGLT